MTKPGYLESHGCNSHLAGVALLAKDVLGVAEQEARKQLHRTLEDDHCFQPFMQHMAFGDRVAWLDDETDRCRHPAWCCPTVAPRSSGSGAAGAARPGSARPPRRAPGPCIQAAAPGRHPLRRAPRVRDRSFRSARTDDEVRAFIHKYGLSPCDAIEQVPGDGTRPSVVRMLWETGTANCRVGYCCAGLE